MTVIGAAAARVERPRRPRALGELAGRELAWPAATNGRDLVAASSRGGDFIEEVSVELRQLRRPATDRPQSLGRVAPAPLLSFEFPLPSFLLSSVTFQLSSVLFLRRASRRLLLLLGRRRLLAGDAVPVGRSFAGLSHDLIRPRRRWP